MALKEDLEGILANDKKRMEEITQKLKSLTQEEGELKKTIESTEYLLSHKFGVQSSDKIRAIRFKDDKPKAVEFIEKVDQLEIAYKSIPDGAFKIMLKEGNKPLHVKEIYNQLIEKGKEIKNPSSVGVGLSRDNRFKRLGKNVFVLTEESLKNNKVPL